MGKEKQIKIMKGGVCYMCVYTELAVFKVLNMFKYDMFDAARNGVVVLVNGVEYKYNRIGGR